MDNELIRMCDVPEIQDRWEPKLFDTVAHKKRRYKAHVSYICLPRMDITDKHGKHHSCLLADGNIIYIPRIEDVLEWLGERIEKLCRVHNENWHTTPFIERADTAIKALLKAYMHLEHNKTWDGEAWAKN
jgi:hypothetical protein